MHSNDEWEEEDSEYVRGGGGARLRPSNVKELRDLLDEIRRMTAAEPTSFLSEEGFAALL